MKLLSISGECSRSWILRTCLVALALASVTFAAQTQTPAQSQRPPQANQARRAPAARLQPVQLPQPTLSSNVTFEQAVDEMQRVQSPGGQRLDLVKLSQLAWAVRSSMPMVVAPAPTPGPAGEESPMRAFFVLPEGLFAYEPMNHILQPINEGDIRATLASAVTKQTIAPPGGCQIILTTSARDYTARYGTRARTVMAMQAGKVAQNVQLEAIAQGLGYVAIDAVDGADVRRVARVPRGYEPLYMAIVGYPATQTTQAAEPTEQSPTAQAGRRALLVVPAHGFQDQELFETRRALELAGVQVMVGSTRMGPLIGMAGGTASADVLLNQVSVDNFDAVVFIGGTGTAEYVRNPMVQNLARQVSVRHKVLAAIGTAPTILASAGVLRGARVTAYISEQERISRAGAVYTGNPVEKDGLIITATGALAVPLFAKAILEGVGEVRQ